MEWDLTRSASGVSLGILGAKRTHPGGHEKEVFGLFPGLVRSEYPIGETPRLGTIFISQFMKVRGDFPVDFRPFGWVHSSDKSWWGKWWDLSSSNSELCWNRWGCIMRSGLCSMASRKVPIISMGFWSCVYIVRRQLCSYHTQYNLSLHLVKDPEPRLY